MLIYYSYVSYVLIFPRKSRIWEAKELYSEFRQNSGIQNSIMLSYGIYMMYFYVYA